MNNRNFLCRLDVLLADQKLSDAKASVQAGLSKDAIRNWRRNPDLMPGLRSLRALADALQSNIEYLSGESLSPDVAGRSQVSGMAESDVSMVAPPVAGGAKSAANSNSHFWRIDPRFATLSGYRPGDMIEAEVGLAPRDGDDVLVQIEDLRGGASTHLRQFRRGWVFGPPGSDPDFVDNVRVRIAAVVLRSWRERDGA